MVVSIEPPRKRFSAYSLFGLVAMIHEKRVKFLSTFLLVVVPLVSVAAQSADNEMPWDRQYETRQEALLHLQQSGIPIHDKKSYHAYKRPHLNHTLALHSKAWQAIEARRAQEATVEEFRRAYEEAVKDKQRALDEAREKHDKQRSKSSDTSAADEWIEVAREEGPKLGGLVADEVSSATTPGTIMKDVGKAERAGETAQSAKSYFDAYFAAVEEQEAKLDSLTEAAKDAWAEFESAEQDLENLHAWALFLGILDPPKPQTENSSRRAGLAISIDGAVDLGGDGSLESQIRYRKSRGRDSSRSGHSSLGSGHSRDFESTQKDFTETMEHDSWSIDGDEWDRAQDILDSTG